MARSHVEVLILAVLLVATGLLGSGITIALDDDPAPPATVQQWPDSLDLSGPVTILAGGDPLVEVRPDGTVELLGTAELMTQLPRPKLTAVPADDACPAGGSAISWTWAGNVTTAATCHGAPGEPGPMGPEGMRFLVRMTPFEGSMGPDCEEGGYLLMMGHDNGNGAATAYDGALDADEVEHDVPLCHGMGWAGPAGPAGPPGPAGDSLPGPAGASALVRREELEAPVDGCDAGATRIWGGTDDGAGSGEPGDGSIDDLEKTFDVVVCDEETTVGVDGHNALVDVHPIDELVSAPEIDPPCDGLGGLEITWGVDDGEGGGTPDNDILEQGELALEAPKYVCNGGGDGDGQTIQINGTAPPQIPSPNTENLIDDDGGRGISMAVGIDGLPVISYYSTLTGDLRVAHCEDPLCDVVEVTTLMDAVVASDGQRKSTGIAIGADALPVISYHRDAGAGNELWVAHCNDIACMTPASHNPVDETGSARHPSAITIGPDGNPHIAYRVDDPDGGIRLARCNAVACESPIAISAPFGSPGSGAYLDIAAGPAPWFDTDADARTLVAFHDAASDDPVVAGCYNFSCSLRSLESGTQAGEAIRVTVGWDGMPVVAYVEATGPDYGDGVVAHCGDPRCTSVAPGAVAIHEDGVDTEIAVAIGADHLPVITLLHQGNSLFYTHCGDPACTIRVENQVVGSGVLDAPHDIAIGGDGLPIIAYGTTDDELKTIHLGNVFGSPYWTR